MKVKTIILGFLILILLLTAVLIGRGVWNHMQQRRKLNEALNRFAQIVESGNFDDITLTIYYKDFTVLTPMPWALELFIGGRYQYKVSVSGEQLEEHLDLFAQISNIALIPVRNKSYVDTRLYYIFEHEKYGEILSFLTRGDNYTMFVNGIEVEYNSTFYEVVLPFLPDEAVRQIEGHLSRIRRTDSR